MFSDFDRMVAEMMQEFGFTTTYYVNGSPVVNDSTGTVTHTTTEYTIQAIKMELPRPTNGAVSNSNSLILEGDQVLYVRPVEKADEFATAFVPNPTSDRVLIQGTLWDVISVKEHNPSASDNILYELYVRK